jgi:hypothetical protein
MPWGATLSRGWDRSPWSQGLLTKKKKREKNPAIYKELKSLNVKQMIKNLWGGHTTK